MVCMPAKAPTKIMEKRAIGTCTPIALPLKLSECWWCAVGDNFYKMKQIAC